jgi:hypothetical protein
LAPTFAVQNHGDAKPTQNLSPALCQRLSHEMLKACQDVAALLDPSIREIEELGDPADGLGR